MSTDLEKPLTIYTNAEKLQKEQVKCYIWNILLMLLPNFSTLFQNNFQSLFFP